MADVK